MINETTGYMGQFIITAKYKDGTEETETIYNRVTDKYLNAAINILDGITPDYEIKYFAIGDNASAVTDNPVSLGNEIFRTPVLTSNNNATGQFTTTFTILDSEAVFTWQEVGVFCGSAATATLNTGNCLTRILYNKVKTTLQEISITRVDKIRRN